MKWIATAVILFAGAAVAQPRQIVALFFAGTPMKPNWEIIDASHHPELLKDCAMHRAAALEGKYFCVLVK